MVVVVDVVANEHGALKKVWPMVIDCVLRNACSFPYLKLCRQAYFVRTNELLQKKKKKSNKLLPTATLSINEINEIILFISRMG